MEIQGGRERIREGFRLRKRRETVKKDSKEVEEGSVRERKGVEGSGLGQREGGKQGKESEDRIGWDG